MTGFTPSLYSSATNTPNFKYILIISLIFCLEMHSKNSMSSIAYSRGTGVMKCLKTGDIAHNPLTLLGIFWSHVIKRDLRCIKLNI